TNALGRLPRYQAPAPDFLLRLSVCAFYNSVRPSFCMVINAANTQAVCSFGWVHKGSLWIYRIGNASARVVELSDAKYLTAKAGQNDFFSVVHHWDGDKVDIAAHNHAEPHRPISSISIRRPGRFGAKTESKMTGDNSVWRELPRAYAAFAFGDF